ncbi:MAG: class I SAM-dependent methyltransferase [Gammaproteobacteria bacterium]|nr:class I SAM-dependent methyltransferase [Gammaproteobacteria bacterium]
MKSEQLGSSKFLNLLLKPAGLSMGSTLRKRIMNPVKTLQAADVKPGETILEVGCGTGFFTIPAAQMIGEQGHLIAMDVMSGYLEQVAKKVQAAGLKNVRIIKRDALDTGLESESVDKILLFGVLPFPSLPLNRLLPEMHRILKPDGRIAIWMFPVSFGVPTLIVKSGLFNFINKQKGVYNYRK